MPIHYPAGILAEHFHVRAAAGLFDVSHMGQLRLVGPGADSATERLVPGDVMALPMGRQLYTLLTNAAGGIIDDLIVARREYGLSLVVNAAHKDAVAAHIATHLPAGVRLHAHDDRALLALQGPDSAAVLATLMPRIDRMAFMSDRAVLFEGVGLTVSRSGYTGEDGFEISIPAQWAESFAQLLLADPRVKPIGLGARDSLRLEAGLCLHGQDIDETTTPIEAGLTWTISRRRRAAGGFPGAAIIQDQLAKGASRRRVGILPDGKAPARAGAEIVDEADRPVGVVTSGGFGPSAARPIAMGYVSRDCAEPGRAIGLMVRGRRLEARIATLPFVPHRYSKI
jgi:aminomethyltransferase